MKFSLNHLQCRLLTSTILFASMLLSGTCFGQEATYTSLLSASAARQQQAEKLDPVREALNIITGGRGAIDAPAAVNLIKRNWPAYVEGTPIRVLPEIRAALVMQGDEYDRFSALVRPVLKHLELENRVRLILFKSEVPVTMFSNPNALIFSTRALALLDDEEVRALAGHELLHLIAHPVFVQVVDNRDERGMRLVELFCDAGSAAIMSGMKGDPRKLISGLNKINQTLEVDFQEYQRGTKHPPMKLRTQLNTVLNRMFSPAGQMTKNMP